MELDHVFVFAAEPERTIEALRTEGLVETYRRAHPGQGTANACFCFENAYLEILWVTNAAECGSQPIARTRLLERSKWQTLGTCPIGIAWRDGRRGSASAAENTASHGTATNARASLDVDVPTWPYAPPYLPPGVTIPVAVESDDATVPMLFRSPGSSAPANWPESRRGTLQRTAGLATIETVIVGHPKRIAPGPSLRMVAAATHVMLQAHDADAWHLTLGVAAAPGTIRAIEVA